MACSQTQSPMAMVGGKVSFIDILKASLKLPQVPAQEFRTHTRRDEIVHVFVEGGADAAFFRRQIERHMPDAEYIFYDCDGKNNVIHTRDTISGIRHSAICLYVVDRDLDNYVQGPTNLGNDIFETDGYSVEWYAIRSNPVTSFFRYFIQSPSMDDYLSNAETHFADELESFASITKPYFGYSIASRRKGRKVRFCDVFVKDLGLFDNELHFVVRRGGREKWLRDSSGGNVHPVGFRAVASEIARLKVEPTDAWLRGHFVIELFVKFVGKLIELTNDQMKLQNGYTELRSFRGKLNEPSVFAILSDRAPIVPLFAAYVDRQFRARTNPA